MLSTLFLVNLVVTLEYITAFGKSGKHGDHDHDHNHNHYLRKSYIPELKPAVDPMFEYYISSKDCDSYDWGDSTYICSGLNHLWDCPSTPLEQRNNIGRGVFQTPDTAQNAAKLIVKGISYNIHHDYTNNMASYGDRYFETYPICAIGASDTGGCTTSVDTDAIGNVATQFDGLPHFMWRVGDKVDDNDPGKGAVFFNNFHYDDVFDNTSNSNFNYIGIEQLPPFFTRCILIDVVNYLAPKSGVLARGYHLTKQDFVETLAYQGLYLNKNFRFERGDAVVFRFGYSKYWYPGTTEYYDNDTPGVPFEVAKEFLWDTGVMIIGSDTWGVEPVSDENVDFNLHRYWIVCGGGFLHEGLVLDEWADDAKKGFVPYIGVYSFAALPVTGAAGGAGKPVVWV